MCIKNCTKELLQKKHQLESGKKSKYLGILQINIYKLCQPVNQYMLYLYNKYVK